MFATTTLFHFTAFGNLGAISDSMKLYPHVEALTGDKRPACIYCYDEANPEPLWHYGMTCEHDHQGEQGHATIDDAVSDTRLVRFTVRVPAGEVYRIQLVPEQETEDIRALRALTRNEAAVLRPIPSSEWLSVEWRPHHNAKWRNLPMPLDLEKHPMHVRLVQDVQN